MSDHAVLDENTVRDVLDRVAADEAPPSQVSIAKARRAGRRQIRVRRIYLPGLAPVAAAAAVALVVTLPTGLQVSPGSTRPPAARVLGTAPTAFNPLLPYASFGWLPASFAAAGLGNQATLDSTQNLLTASGPNSSMVWLGVRPAGICKVTGPESFPVSSPSAARTKGLSDADLKRLQTHFPHGLRCDGDISAGRGKQKPGLPLRQRAPDVNGAPAYWTIGSGLAFEYARDAWATLELSAPPPRHPASASAQAEDAQRMSATATQAMMHKIASSVRYGYRAAVSYGFTISGLPANWQVARAGDTYNVASIDGHVVNVGWSAGPAQDPAALSVTVTPAGIPGSISSCKYVAGQTSHVKVDGARGTLRTIDLPDKHWQSLCIPHVAGVQVQIYLDLANPDTSHTPLPGGRQVGNAVTVFRHLRLLGPDVAAWVTSPD